MTMHTIGKNFVGVSVNGAFGPYTLVRPEQNVHGLILRTLNLSAGTIYLGTTPLTGDNTGRIMAFSAVLGGRTEPFMVPAGLGVYIGLRNDYNQLINVTWDYLNADGTVA